MSLYLHNPANQAHIEDLKDRLSSQLARLPRVIDSEDADDLVLIAQLADVVRAMDTGSITPKDALEVFACRRVPGFSFGRWLVEMVDEGVYLDTLLFNEAA